MYKVRNTDVVIDVDGAKQVTDFILVQQYDLLPNHRISKKEFKRMKDRAQKLRGQLDQLGSSIRAFPREVKTKLKQCLEAVAKLVTGRSRVEGVQDLLEQLCAVPA